MTPEQKGRLAAAYVAVEKANAALHAALVELRTQIDATGIFELGWSPPLPDRSPLHVKAPTPPSPSQAEELYQSSIIGMGPVHLGAEGEKSDAELQVLVDEFQKHQNLTVRYHDDKSPKAAEAGTGTEPAEEPRGRVVSLQVDSKRLLAQIVWSVDARKMLVTRTLTKLSAPPGPLVLSP